MKKQYESLRNRKDEDMILLFFMKPDIPSEDICVSDQIEHEALAVAGTVDVDIRPKDHADIPEPLAQTLHVPSEENNDQAVRMNPDLSDPEDTLESPNMPNFREVGMRFLNGTIAIFGFGDKEGILTFYPPKATNPPKLSMQFPSNNFGLMLPDGSIVPIDQEDEEALLSEGLAGLDLDGKE